MFVLPFNEISLTEVRTRAPAGCAMQACASEHASSLRKSSGLMRRHLPYHRLLNDRGMSDTAPTLSSLLGAEGLACMNISRCWSAARSGVAAGSRSPWTEARAALDYSLGRSRPSCHLRRKFPRAGAVMTDWASDRRKLCAIWGLPAGVQRANVDNPYFPNHLFTLGARRDCSPTDNTLVEERICPY